MKKKVPKNSQFLPSLTLSFEYNEADEEGESGEVVSRGQNISDFSVDLRVFNFFNFL